MTKINPSQIFSIAVLMRLFTLISSTEKLSSDNICGVFISIAFQAVLLFPLLKVYHINPDFINRKTSKIYLVIVSLFLILISAENMCNFWNTSNSINFPIGSKYIALALLSVVCIYGCAVGLKAMGRSAFLLLILSIFALLLLIIGSISKINPNYFTPVSTGNNILRAAIIDFSQSVELVPLILLLSYSTKRFSTKGFFATKLLILCIITFVAMTVLGHLMPFADYPFFSIGAYSHPLSLQRTDALYITLFTMLCVLFVSVNIFLCATLISIIVPKCRYPKFTAVLLTLIATFLLSRLSLNFSYINSIPLLFIIVISPFVIYGNSRKFQPLNNEENI